MTTASCAAPVSNCPSRGRTNPSQQLLIGYVSDSNTSFTGGFGTIQATWDGVTITLPLCFSRMVAASVFRPGTLTITPIP